LQVERIRIVTGLKVTDYWKSWALPICVSAIVGIPWLLLATKTGITSKPMLQIILGIVACLLIYGLSGLFRFRSDKLANEVREVVPDPATAPGMMQEPSATNGD